MLNLIRFAKIPKSVSIYTSNKLTKLPIHNSTIPTKPSNIPSLNTYSSITNLSKSFNKIVTIPNNRYIHTFDNVYNDSMISNKYRLINNINTNYTNRHYSIFNKEEKINKEENMLPLELTIVMLNLILMLIAIGSLVLMTSECGVGILLGFIGFIGSLVFLAYSFTFMPSLTAIGMYMGIATFIILGVISAQSEREK